jgi:hypothetical protein
VPSEEFEHTIPVNKRRRPAPQTALPLGCHVWSRGEERQLNQERWSGDGRQRVCRRTVSVRSVYDVQQGYTGLFKKKYTLQKFILQKLLTLNPCPMCGWKGNLSKFWNRWSEEAHHWGSGWCYLWHAATSVGRVGLSIWYLPRHTWGSHGVLVRCENNFESSPFSLFIEHHHMFNSTCKISIFLNNPV